MIFETGWFYIRGGGLEGGEGAAKNSKTSFNKIENRLVPPPLKCLQYIRPEYCLCLFNVVLKMNNLSFQTKRGQDWHLTPFPPHQRMLSKLYKRITRCYENWLFGHVFINEVAVFLCSLISLLKILALENARVGELCLNRSVLKLID